MRNMLSNTQGKGELKHSLSFTAILVTLLFTPDRSTSTWETYSRFPKTKSGTQKAGLSHSWSGLVRHEHRDLSAFENEWLLPWRQDSSPARSSVCLWGKLCPRAPLGASTDITVACQLVHRWEALVCQRPVWIVEQQSEDRESLFSACFQALFYVLSKY